MLTENDSTLIIAEAGVNHNGDLDLAYRLIDIAVEAGVDVVKFQTFRSELLVTENAKKAEYQINSNANQESQYEMLRKLEISKEDHFRLIEHCKKAGIEFLSTAFDLESLEFLKSLNLKRVKIPSGEITNLPYLEQVAKIGLPIILSTGMAKLGEIEAAVHALIENGARRNLLTVLHCNTEYPTPFQDVNLRAMVSIAHSFGVEIGYSDHTDGIEVAIAAVSLGAKVIEKHFTIDKSLPGPDHKASLDPVELKKMVRAIRNIEQALGNGIKEPSESEKKNVSVTRKSLVAATPIEAGETFTKSNLTAKRPGFGISPMLYYDVLGKVSKRKFQKDELIEL
ncbi:N-acetylneuraminate synthase [Leptospira jelokensis]|uniref:N-acetylneuraminate synthase n=1 Tax=Leptospira jelokensis TaxID=2484931 RepID=UPI0010910AB2|nr:N-acetylneuraminate synthase [Leptospira jelokensis]TGL99204.1 N-acetylneuraminate synthase [Leptospira jelokensis]